MPEEELASFKNCLILDFEGYFDGLAFIALLLFHKKNFKPVKLVEDNQVSANSVLRNSLNSDAETLLHFEVD